MKTSSWKIKDDEEGGSKHLSNICQFLRDYMSQHPRRQNKIKTDIREIGFDNGRCMKLTQNCLVEEVVCDDGRCMKLAQNYLVEDVGCDDGRCMKLAQNCLVEDSDITCVEPSGSAIKLLVTNLMAYLVLYAVKLSTIFFLFMHREQHSARSRVSASDKVGYLPIALVCVKYFLRVLFQNSPPTLSLSALFFPSQSC
jgi:hypothetical protein